jgi:hypothetical protein
MRKADASKRQEQADRRIRLAEYIEEKHHGNQTEAGKALGLTGGAYLRQLLLEPNEKGYRPITDSTLRKWRGRRGVGNFFEDVERLVVEPHEVPLVRSFLHSIRKGLPAQKLRQAQAPEAQSPPSTGEGGRWSRCPSNGAQVTAGGRTA